jgi:two-component sensor histidine kinase
LASTHELLSQRHWRGVSLSEIARCELAPYATDNIEINGPSVVLKAEATQGLAMVVHELTTNAAKYGALSDPAGCVRLGWRWLRNGSHGPLVIEWQEIGGPPVVTPRRFGYGTSIVRELIPFEPGGTVDLVFARDGLRCRVEVPAEWIGSDTPAPAAFQSSNAAASSRIAAADNKVREDTDAHW